MEIQQAFDGNIAVISMSGRIMGGPDSTEVNKIINQLIDEKHVNVVIDLSGVELMNSSGLGILIQANQMLKNAGGGLKLANVTEKIQSLFVITKLNTVFETYSSLSEAKQAF